MVAVLGLGVGGQHDSATTYTTGGSVNGGEEDECSRLEFPSQVGGFSRDRGVGWG